MVSKLFLLLLLTGVNAADGGIDLTVIPLDITEDGMTQRQLRFKCDEGRIAFIPPPGWNFNGAGSRAQLTPSQKAFAEGIIETAASPKPLPIDDAAKEAFKQQVIATLPTGSQGVETVSEAENSLMPGGNPEL